MWMDIAVLPDVLLKHVDGHSRTARCATEACGWTKV